MPHTRQMLEAHPGQGMFDLSAVAETIDVLYECVQTCTICADACLAEPQVDMLRRCIRLNLDCADLCETTARVLSRLTEYDADVIRSTLEACAVACAACGVECERHAAHMRHCEICAERCRACEQACRQLLQAVPAR